MTEKMREYLNYLLDYYRDPHKLCGFDDVYFPLLTQELLRDEEQAKQFFRECSDHEFDVSAYTYEELVDKFGVPFLKWLVQEGARRELTDDDGLFEMNVILINAGFKPVHSSITREALRDFAARFAKEET